MSEFENTLEIPSIKPDNEIIKNLELRNYLQFKLNKDDIVLEDLDSIKEIIMDSQNIVGQYNKVYFDEIDLFKNLDKISIRNLGLTPENTEKINNIEKVEFINSQLKDIKKLNNSISLVLNNTEVENFEDITYLSNLEELQLINIEIDNFDFLKNFKKLKKLVIKNIKNFSLSEIDFLLPIEYLSVENLETLDLNVLSKYENLKTISVDRIEADNWESELKTLKAKNIEILLNDMYEY